MTFDEKIALNRRVATAMGAQDASSGLGVRWFYPNAAQTVGALDFCDDPAAADALRMEIERRRWVWSISPGIDDDKYFCMVTGGTARCSKPPYGLAVSNDSPWHALSLAFLAAHEEKESKND